MDDFKKLLGDELFNQVSEKLGEKKVFLYEGDKKPSIIDGKNYVPKTTFNEVNEQNKSLKDQLESVNKNLAELEKKAEVSDTLKAEIKNIQTANENLKKEADEKLKTTLANERKNYEVKMKLISAGVHEDKMKFILSEVDFDKISLEENGNLTGYSEQEKTLKESFVWAFGEEKTLGKPPKNNGKPATPGDGKPMSTEDWLSEVYDQK